MKQFIFQDNQLNIKVNKSPLITRLILFPTAFLFFLLPISGMFLDLSAGNKFKFYSLIIVGIFSLMGFYLLRVSLWNTFGEEIIKISQNKVTYQASYGWFKGGEKEITFEHPNYSIKPIGYEEENNGVLVFGSDQSKIESIIQIPIVELEGLLINLGKIRS